MRNEWGEGRGESLSPATLLPRASSPSPHEERVGRGSGRGVAPAAAEGTVDFPFSFRHSCSRCGDAAPARVVSPRGFAGGEGGGRCGWDSWAQIKAESILPLSLTLSPFVPHGERESTLGKSICVVLVFFARKANENRVLKNFFSHPWSPKKNDAIGHRVITGVCRPWDRGRSAATKIGCGASKRRITSSAWPSRPRLDSSSARRWLSVSAPPACSRTSVICRP